MLITQFNATLKYKFYRIYTIDIESSYPAKNQVSHF